MIQKSLKMHIIIQTNEVNNCKVLKLKNVARVERYPNSIRQIDRKNSVIICSIGISSVSNKR